MKNIFVMLPCYNEEKDIEPLVRRWISLDDDIMSKGYECVVFCIDDKSTDGTNSVIRCLSDEFLGKVYLLEHEMNKGLGGALSTGFNYFNEHGQVGDVCVLMDGDNTHDPKYTLDMLPYIEQGYDCVIASRYKNTSKTIGVPAHRQFLSDCARIVYTLLLGIKNVKDYTCGYRAYSFSIIEKAINAYGKNMVERRSFACMMETLYKLSLIEGKFFEIPFELQYSNKRGESKMRVIKTIRESLATAFQLRLSLKRRMKSQYARRVTE